MLKARWIALAVAAVIVWSAAGRAQQPDADADITRALDTIKSAEKSGGSMMALEGARRTLVAKRDKSFKDVLILLDLNETPVRLNAAIVLSGMAQAGERSAPLLEALQRCLRDSSPAVAHWGLTGIFATSARTPVFPPNDRAAALKYALDMGRPSALRQAALQAAADAIPKEAIPVLVEHLQALLPEIYSQGLVTGRLLTGLLTWAQKSAPELPITDPAFLALPFPEQETRLRAVLDRMPAAQKEEAILTLEAIPLIAEMHITGMLLEARFKAEYPAERESFGFDSIPPWNLVSCVDKAVKGLADHRGDFPASAPAAPPAPAPAAPPT